MSMVAQPGDRLVTRWTMSLLESSFSTLEAISNTEKINPGFQSSNRVYPAHFAVSDLLFCCVSTACVICNRSGFVM